MPQTPSPVSLPLDDEALSRWSEVFAQAMAGRSWHRALFAHPKQTAPEGAGKDDWSRAERVTLKPLMLKGEPHVSALIRFPTRDVTRNVPVAQAPALWHEALAAGFQNLHLDVQGVEWQLARSRKGKFSLRKGKSAHAADEQDGVPGLGHARQKERLIDVTAPFLGFLGVTDAQGQVIPAMSRKWKQINKFLEIFSAAWDQSGLAAEVQSRPVRVADFGSGKGYLTFALHHFLRAKGIAQVQVVGVELRQDMVDLCNAGARKLGLDGLVFECGDVRQYPFGHFDVMVALHACDIATDHALHMGIRSGARIVMCSPCCHKEVRPQLKMPQVLRPLLQHGVHLGQEAEMLTDGLRALLLESRGYTTQVFEFVQLEHTSKNKMILGVRKPEAQAKSAQEVLADIQALKQFYGVRQQTLESLLQGSADVPGA